MIPGRGGGGLADDQVTSDTGRECGRPCFFLLPVGEPFTTPMFFGASEPTAANLVWGHPRFD